MSKEEDYKGLFKSCQKYNRGLRKENSELKEYISKVLSNSIFDYGTMVEGNKLLIKYSENEI